MNKELFRKTLDFVKANEPQIIAGVGLALLCAPYVTRQRCEELGHAQYTQKANDVPTVQYQRPRIYCPLLEPDDWMPEGHMDDIYDSFREYQETMEAR